MAEEKHRPSLSKIVTVAAIAGGVAVGSYGIANAASGSGSTGTTSTPAPSQSAAPSQANGGPPAGTPWGGQRSDETLLTGDTAAKVRAAALARVSGGTVVRVETDADGHAAYEAHMVASDGTPTTVYVDEDFNVVSVETR